MYSYTKIKDDGFIIRYTFQDENYKEYMVQFKNDFIQAGPKRILGKSYEMAFFIKNDIGEWDATILSNSGSPFKIIDTVFGNIMKTFLRDNMWVREIWLEGLPKPGEVGQSQRTKMYIRKLKNDPIPGFKLFSSGNRIELKNNF
jgi:hypothetical protein